MPFCRAMQRSVLACWRLGSQRQFSTRLHLCQTHGHDGDAERILIAFETVKGDIETNSSKAKVLASTSDRSGGGLRQPATPIFRLVQEATLSDLTVSAATPDDAEERHVDTTAAQVTVSGSADSWDDGDASLGNGMDAGPRLGLGMDAIHNYNRRPVR